MGGLFSGIGGFELASQWAGIEPLWSNDYDKKCCKTLRKNFSHKIIHKSIVELTKEDIEPVDIICGGDPCQPHSVAGLGKGTEDNRYLWPEMLRIIRGIGPAFVLNENVDGTIANGVLDRKINDLEAEGYACQSYVIPAESVGALHRRFRVWLVAYDPNRLTPGRKAGEIQSTGHQKKLPKRHKVQHTGQPADLWAFGANTDTERFKEQYNASKSSILQEGLSGYFGFGPAPHGHISRDFLESGVIGMLNGLPAGMDYPDRYTRTAQLGNAIVPQVAYEFLRWMKITANK